MDYLNHHYLIFDLTELYLVDFNLILEDSVDTVRKSVDETKTFIRWEGDPPDFILSMQTKQGPYTYEEILNILNTEDWTYPEDLI
jgi:hypothetical protein